MTTSATEPDEDRSGPRAAGNGAGDKRWRLIADVAVFQGKLVLDGLRDFVLSPVAVGAALIGIATSREDPGRYFYRLMRWGHWSDQAINLFHSKGAPRAESPGHDPAPEGANVDRIADQLEQALIEQYARSAFARAAKDSIDRGLDRVTAAPQVDRKGLRKAARNIVRGLERAGIRRRHKSGRGADGPGTTQKGGK